MWNHNSHYHNYLLRQLPIEVEQILDVGCGQGLFASKVANRAKRVDAIDVDRATIEEAVNKHVVITANYFSGSLVDSWVQDS
jgi:2-polyprenyl-3-methyl-5-hydroxy-6-metoxy-1,4-benzoquinol methylase